MRPNLYLYSQENAGYLLYLGEFSTTEALHLFSGETELQIVSLGATLYKQYGFATERDIPAIHSVKEAIHFLTAEDDIALIDFQAILIAIGTLFTHDDGECRFLLNSEKLAIDVMKSVAPPQYRDLLINKLLQNQGSYFSCNETGHVVQYYSFEEYWLQHP